VNLRAIGCNVRSAGVELREKLAFTAESEARAAAEFAARFAAETVILSTCNRVELYLARLPGEQPLDIELVAEVLGEIHGLPAALIAPHLYAHADTAAVAHLFGVAASLDSLIVGEGQIAGQVKDAYEAARLRGTAGPLTHALFTHALRTAKRVRSETGISLGHVSISSVAVDYVRQVFDRFDDKTVLVIGAGKMGRLTLKHLAELKPGQVLVTNRSPEKAVEVAAGCGGKAVPWDKLDAALIDADIALSTTGAGEAIMPKARYDAKIRPLRTKPLVVLDIAVPRDFDPAIHDGDAVSVFNIDDLERVRERTLAERRAEIPAAERIVAAEVAKFAADWSRRATGPTIRDLQGEADRLRAAVVEPLLGKLNGKLTPTEREQIAGAFRLFQNRLLHGPIAAVQEAAATEQHGSLLSAVRKLFRLGD
jgi:glutamyl-tRNA reductase